MKRKLQITSLTSIILLMIIITPLSLHYAEATSATPEALFGRRNRILWDQSHGIYQNGWEYSITGYFSSLASELSDAGFIVDSLDEGPVTYELLKGYKIFVVCIGSNWYTPYSSEEVDAIVKAVKRGTSLLILGEQAWGPNEIVNAISQEFGVTCGGPYFANMITNFAEHPVFSGVSTFQPMGGGSLEVSGAATAIAWDDDGNVAVAAYKKFRGFNKVIVIGDMDCFTNSYLYDYDNLQIALNLFNYLNQILG